MDALLAIMKYYLDRDIKVCTFGLKSINSFLVIYGSERALITAFKIKRFEKQKLPLKNYQNLEKKQNYKIIYFPNFISCLLIFCR